MHNKKMVQVNGIQFDKSNPNSRTLISPPILKNLGALLFSLNIAPKNGFRTKRLVPPVLLNYRKNEIDIH